MKIKIKIGTVDMDGYCGRELHPEREDEGAIGVLEKMERIHGEALYTVRLGEYRRVELVDHEIEAVAGPFWDEDDEDLEDEEA